MEERSRQPRTWLYIAAAGVALISAAAGASLWQLLQDRPAAARTEVLTVLPEPRPLGHFELTGQDGNPFTPDDLRGRWTLTFFGFTHCPDICPSTLYDLQQVDQALRERAPDSPPGHQVLFVSVDPERDTPERLAEYVAFFSPDFRGATAADERLRPLARQLGVAYRIEDHDAGSTQYTVYHSASILLIDPDGRLYGVFTAPHDATAIGFDLVQLLGLDA
jgi:protein SCO1/2